MAGCLSWYQADLTGSSHALYLGASARIARLQAEHLRLSINAMALRSSTHSGGHESIVTYLRKALNAAKSTIQAHFESSQTDLALSFATDVGFRSSLPTSSPSSSGYRLLMASSFLAVVRISHRLLADCVIIVHDHGLCPSCSLSDPLDKGIPLRPAGSLARPRGRQPLPHHVGRPARTGRHVGNALVELLCTDYSWYFACRRSRHSS